MKSRCFALLIAGTLVCAPQLSAAAATFEGLGALPWITPYSQALGISGDGTVVFGTSHTASGGPQGEPFRWTRQEGLVPLPNFDGGPASRFPLDASYDGSVIVGTGRYPYSTFVGIQWSGGVATPLAGYGDNLFGSSATGISSDGTKIVGTSDHNGFSEAALWTSGSIMGLGDLPGGFFQSEAYNISNDGSTVVGMSYGEDYIEAFRWTSVDGMVGLGTLEPGFESSAFAVSANGAVVVGETASGGGMEAFRWTEATGMVGLGDVPGGPFDSAAGDISADGSLVLGHGYSDTGPVAVLWKSGSMIPFVDYLLAHDVQGMDGWSQIAPAAMSDDGRIFAGTGLNPSGTYEAWIATVPEPTSWTLAFFAAFGLWHGTARRAGK